MARRKKNKKKKVVNEEYYALSPETKKGLGIIFLAVVAIISILSFMGMAGAIGVMIDNGLSSVFGLTKIIFPLALCGIIYSTLKTRLTKPRAITTVGLILFYLSITGLFHINFPLNKSLDMAFSGEGGGLIGFAVSYPLLTALGFWGAIILLIAITAASLLLALNYSSLNILEKMAQKREQAMAGEDDYDNEDDEDNEVEVELEEKTEKRGLFTRKVPETKEPAEEERESTTEKFADSKFKQIKIDLPINLLSKKFSKPKSGDVSLAMERIETTLANFGIEVEMSDVNIGPTVTQYSLKPAEGVKVAKITALNNDLALALAAHPIRIEAPIPGKSLVGIEVPNHQPAVVSLREVIESKSFKTIGTNLGMGLGKDVAGNCWAADLTKMPHLLVAGATGSGKSVCLNDIIISLLYQNNPDMLRMILIDPKRVEFPIYNGIPHLLTPVVTNVTKAVNALRWTIQEMDQRFDILSKEGKRNIAAYNSSAEDKMPYIVIVIDELADLMIAASNEVEACIIRLTQMARAVGIHLIVATQRPSVDVITGLIKANIPGRIAFSVASSMDSRTILDSVGAEKLIGKGDMLYQTAEISKPRRLQGAYVSDGEIKRVVHFLKQAAGEPEYDESVTEKQSSKTSFDFGGGGNGGDSDGDDLLNEAKDLVIKAGKASASYLQRRLRIGYARAARLIDLLEEHGIVGPADGARPRDILVTAEEAKEESEQTPTVFKQQKQLDDNFDSSEEFEKEKEIDDHEDDDLASQEVR